MSSKTEFGLNLTYFNLPFHEMAVDNQSIKQARIGEAKKLAYRVLTQTCLGKFNTEICKKKLKDENLDSFYRIAKIAFERQNYELALKNNQIAYLSIFKSLKNQKKEETDVVTTTYLFALFYIEAHCLIKIHDIKSLKKTLKLIGALQNKAPGKPCKTVSAWALTLLGGIELQRSVPKTRKAIFYSQQALTMKDKHELRERKSREIHAQACINLIIAFNIEGKRDESKLYQVKAVLLDPELPILKTLKQTFF